MNVTVLLAIAAITGGTPYVAPEPCAQLTVKQCEATTGVRNLEARRDEGRGIASRVHHRRHRP